MAHFDIAIIGTGSGNSILDERYADKKVAICEQGVFGGTCLNVGCIPTKMFVYSAEVAQTVTDAARFGVDARIDGVRWADIVSRVFGRIDPIAAGGENYRRSSPNVEVFASHTRFRPTKPDGRYAFASAANLQAADLAHADLVHARLTHANLGDANLQNAALDHADLSGSILRHAGLSDASLRFATLDGADLEGADLSRADLAHARLAHTNLAGANLSDAVLDYADFAGADLSQADLSGARLYNVRNLLTSQLEAALGDAATILPSHLQGCVPWSAVGDERLVPLLDPAEFWLLQARRDLRRRTFYGQSVRVAGALLVGAVATTAFVTETARDTLPAGRGEVQRRSSRTLSMLPERHEQAPALGMAAAIGTRSGSPSPEPRGSFSGPCPPCCASRGGNRRARRGAGAIGGGGSDQRDDLPGHRCNTASRD